MTTIINSPAPEQNNNGFGFLIGAIILVGFVALLLYFGIPAVKQMNPIQVNVPAPQVEMPDKIDINVNQPK
jgi:hypothetical protein